ncbi:hypothetical protein DERP_010717 [Dermatophagoides pteronyssinus]|uniref:ELM2 domain-containing protein n=1 Tax=Dermatophagoides pteronyssinus TaxID=6956 RepID=A0ABQ8J6I8_DERPT|nr:hypothetical protein DERP_010717 [Dermatophagoides pteronyssinus]
MTNIPDYIPPDKRRDIDSINDDDDQLVFQPNIINDEELNEFIELCRTTNKWNVEQSLGFLHSFNYNIRLAMKNLHCFHSKCHFKQLDRCQQVYLQRFIHDDNRIVNNQFPNQFELAKIFITGDNDNDRKLIRKEIINEIIRSETKNDDEIIEK